MILLIVMPKYGYSQDKDSVFFDKGTQLLYYSPNFIYLGVPSEKLTLISGWEHSLGYSRFIAPRYSLRASILYASLKGKNDFPLDYKGYIVTIGHQYQIFKRRRSPFHLGQEFTAGFIQDNYKNDVHRTVGTNLLFGFTSPLFRKYPKWYIGMEGGYQFYYTTQNNKTHLQGSPLVFMLQYYLTKSVHYTPKK